MRNVIEVSVKEAQAEFEPLMAAVARGEKVVIRDGAAVAELAPARA